jgi:hypothetical protein
MRLKLAAVGREQTLEGALVTAPGGGQKLALPA